MGASGKGEARKLLAEEVNRIIKTLRTPSEYQKVIDKLDQRPRRRGRPRRRRLPRGGSSRSDSDLIVITALEQDRNLVEEICCYSGLSPSRVYRSLRRLKARNLVTSHERKWRLVNDAQKIQAYDMSRTLGLKWVLRYTLDDLKKDLIMHHGSKEKKRGDIARFVKIESRHKEIPYLIRKTMHKSYSRYKRGR